jgi:hypothetical protein
MSFKLNLPQLGYLRHPPCQCPSSTSEESYPHELYFDFELGSASSFASDSDSDLTSESEFDSVRDQCGGAV